MNQSTNKYDLTERTTRFGVGIIKFCKAVKGNSVSNPLISQLVRAGTSIGANYAEANNSSSKKDFRNKIFTCKKEAQETKYWLQMIRECIDTPNDLEKLSRENQELLMIFQKICSSLNK